MLRSMKTRAYKMKFACHHLSVCKNEAKQDAAFFENYDLKYKKKEKVLKSGGSGTAVQLSFEKKASQGTFKGVALMKIVNSEKGKKADNLYHEAVVGFRVNEIAERFPCFIRTFGLYREGKTGHKVNGKHFEPVLQTPSLDEMCATAGHQALMIEYVKGKSIKQYYKTEPFRPNLYPVLFQLYFALKMLGSTYTHYDLHTSNVMLSHPKAGHCVRFEYTMPGQTIPLVFFSVYVAKIIDYGRNYEASVNPMMQTLGQKTETGYVHPHCNDKRCGHEGNKCGFINFKNPKHLGLGFRRPNVSHDLRLLNYVQRVLGSKWQGPKVQFNKDTFSTEEIAFQGLPKSINNVEDAGNYLATVVQESNKAFEGMPVYGIVRVDGVQPWSFELNPKFKKETSKQQSHSSGGTRKKGKAQLS